MAVLFAFPVYPAPPPPKISWRVSRISSSTCRARSAPGNIEALAAILQDRKPHRVIRRPGLRRRTGAHTGMPATEIQGVAALSTTHGKLPCSVKFFETGAAHAGRSGSRIHPQVGAEIISGVPFRIHALLHLSHQYAGRRLPCWFERRRNSLGARILWSDYFDALDVGASAPAMNPRRGHRLLRQESGKADPVVDGSSTCIRRSSRRRQPGTWPQVYPSRATHRRFSPRSVSSTNRRSHERLRRHRAAHRDLCCMKSRDGQQPGVADTMALISLSDNVVPFVLRCISTARNQNRCTAASRRCRVGHRSTVDDPQRPWSDRLRPGTADRSERAAERRFRSRWIMTPTTLLSALVCPLVFNERLSAPLRGITPELGPTDDHRRLLTEFGAGAAVIYNSMVFEQTQEDCSPIH